MDAAVPAKVPDHDTVYGVIQRFFIVVVEIVLLFAKIYEILVYFV